MTVLDELVELTPEVPAPDWTAALCAQTDPELFFPEHGHADQAATAKRICGSCDLSPQCREWAIATGQDHGVWGGLSGRQLQQERRQRQRQVVTTDA